MDVIHKRVDLQQQLTTFTLTGDIGDFRLVIDAINEFYKGDVTKLVLWDMTNADVNRISTQEVNKIADLPLYKAERRMGGKNAIVAPDQLAYGLSRIYETVVGLQNQPFETRVFRNLEDACAWLGVTLPDDALKGDAGTAPG